MKATFGIQLPTSNTQWECGRRGIGRWMLNVGCRTFSSILLFACLGGGFAVCLRAGEPSDLSVTNSTPAERAVGEADMVELLTATLQREYVKEKGELELRFKQSWPARRVPDEPLTVKILELPNAGVTPSCIVRFELRAGDRVLGNWQVAVQARVWRETWVARSALKRGEPVSTADVGQEKRDVLLLREATAEFAPGDPALELAEPLQAGAPLLARSIRLRPVIHRGQMTDALVRDGALSISLKVEALEDGAPGQFIRARNPISRRDVSGKVLDQQTLLISL